MCNCGNRQSNILVEQSSSIIKPTDQKIENNFNSSKKIRLIRMSNHNIFNVSNTNNVQNKTKIVGKNNDLSGTKRTHSNKMKTIKFGKG